jgi:preprotein translocase subunit SecG
MQGTTLSNALQIIQIILSLALIIVIILQARGQGLGSLFGGGDAGMGITKTRRGLERTLFQITIILAALFLLNAVIQLMIQPSAGLAL